MANVSVHRFLVTSDTARRMDVWATTGAYANWIEGRENGARETWLVTCFDEHREAFLAAARTAGVTVERIDGTGEAESYELLVGAPGTGWTPVG
jgi:hypothetical protein